MTTTTAENRMSPGSALGVVPPAVVALGCGALAARVALADASSHPTSVLVALFCALLIVGASLPLPPPPAPVLRLCPMRDICSTGAQRRVRAAARPEREPRRARVSFVVALVGIAAFAAGRVLVGGHPPMSFTGYAVATSTLAAVAEEVWFRRLCFGLLLPAGPGFAIGGSTLLFAVVHVVTYGWWVLPLDLAAGALLGWQRAVSGSWTAPAVTHVVANLLVLL